MDNSLAPIILFVYNRPWHTEQTLEALTANELADQSTLYIYCDGPKKNASEEDLNTIIEVRTLIRKKHWCKEVLLIERDENFGLADSVIKGVTEVIERHGKIIVLEDDIKVHPEFLIFMNKALNYYESLTKVFHISGFSHGSNLQFFLKDLFFLKFMSCWGWATWKDRWDLLNLDYNYFYKILLSNPKILYDYNYSNSMKFHYQLRDNLKGNLHTWAILWYSSIYFNNGLCLTPRYSLVENIGMDGSGVHCTKNSLYTQTFKHKKGMKFNVDNLKIKETVLSRLHLILFFKYGLKFSLIKILKFNKIWKK